MSLLDRRRLLAVLGAGLAAPRTLLAAAPSEAIAQRLADAERNGKVFGLHALLVSQGGKFVFEHYGQGVDVAWDRLLDNVVFGPDVAHDLRSVSKSVVGLAYGVALAAGKVPPPDAKLYGQFPEYADLARQPGRDKITIHHVLSMTLGFDWDELTIPYGDPRNSEMAMEAAADRYRFILERPIVGERGVKWTYCGGATALLGRLIAKGTGEALPAYCRRVLFDPMGFGPSDWSVGRDGEPRAASGLRLLPRDLLKIGRLMLAGGTWNGTPIVPADWVKRVTTPVVPTSNIRSYGYHWYMGDYAPGTTPQPLHWFGGVGWGGQYLFVIPARDLVIVIHCGNYRRTGAEQTAVMRTLMTEIVLPNFV
ncbi:MULTISPECIES: serine hydrolase [unclassified Bradyrhizobium]|uniref:serine hydrolase domain-containing protein n=1 Tax=unclassified Bradyrhizobium TaxID=2631580 RepID=UPI000423579D|nr:MULTISPECIES: serine hydrolase [unclassified Bradyrhizobium]MCP3463925.1 beta-lactamase family protein [Bradyrhizobium sp. CCGUVB23]